MFHLDNNSGVSAMPPAGAVESSAPRWFTEGGSGMSASYPGAAWFNIIQAELLNVLSAYGIPPDKADLTQLKKAIEEAIRQKATAASVLLTAIAALNTSANKLPYFTGKDSVAMTDLTQLARTLLGRTNVADILSDLGLKTAAQRDVGTGANQIPDMSAWTSGPNWRKHPDGTIEQWGIAIGDSNGNVTVRFPVAFSSRPDSISFCNLQLGTPVDVQNVVIDNNNFDYAGFACRNLAYNGTAIIGSASSFMWTAKGK